MRHATHCILGSLLSDHHMTNPENPFFLDVNRGAAGAVQITGIDVCPLSGATVDGGWPQGHEPQEGLHTVVILYAGRNTNRLWQLLYVGPAGSGSS